MVIVEVGLLGQTIDCLKGINEISKKLRDKSLSPERKFRLKSEIERLALLRKNSFAVVKSGMGYHQSKKIEKDDVVEVGSTEWQNKAGGSVLKFHQQVCQKEAEKRTRQKI